MQRLLSPRQATTGFLAQTAVVIPALNEAPCIAATVAYWRSLGAAEVCVVDNASVDATAIIAAAAGAKVCCERSRGYGAAAATGARVVSPANRWILFSSADGSDQLQPDERAAFQHAVDAGALLVVGNRTADHRSRARLALAQRWGNQVACALIKWGWGRTYHDLGSLRLVDQRALRAWSIQDRGFGWNIEMQIRAIEHGAAIAEVPVEWFPRRGGSNKISGTIRGTVRAGWGMSRNVVKLWLTRHVRQGLSACVRSEPAG